MLDQPEDYCRGFQCRPACVCGSLYIKVMVERLAPHFFIHYGTSKDLFLFSSSMKDAWIMKGQQGQYLLLREYPFHHVLECRSAHQKCQECVYTSWIPAGIQLVFVRILCWLMPSTWDAQHRRTQLLCLVKLTCLMAASDSMLPLVSPSWTRCPMSASSWQLC